MMTVTTPAATSTRHGGSSTSLDTPSPTSGARSASASGQREPVIVTPRHGPCRASSENVVPAGSATCTGRPGRAIRTWSAPHQPSTTGTSARASAAEGAEGGDGVVETIAAAGDEDDAFGVHRRGARQRQLGVGRRLVGRVALDRDVRRRPVEPGGVTRSRGRRPARRDQSGGAGMVEAAVGGDDRGRRRQRQHGDGIERRAAGRHHHGVACSFGHRFLRRHYPDQVLGSAAAATLSAH